MRYTRPLRGRKAAKRVDTSALEALVADGRMWCKLGKVFAPDGGSHWQVKDGKLLIEVETLPDGLDLTCRLATWGSGGGFGGWSIPRVGSIVAVLVPDGMPEFHPIVIGVLDCNATPAGVGEGMTLIADDRTVAIRAPKVQLGSSEANEQAVLGTTQSSQLATLLADMALAFADVSTNIGSSPCATAATACTTFIGNLQTMLSSIVKVAP